MEYVEQNGQIELLDDKLIIRRKGLGVFFSQSLKGEMSIPYSSISAAQYKPAGMSIVGHIQFLVNGIDSPADDRAVDDDENSVVFGESRQREFAELRSLVEAKIAQAKAP